jgi:protein-tyrosine-phosphatase
MPLARHAAHRATGLGGAHASGPVLTLTDVYVVMRIAAVLVARNAVSPPSCVTSTFDRCARHTHTDLKKGVTPVTDKPTVLFVCVHNAGRSQMAAAYLKQLSGGRVEVLSAGSAPADAVNPAAVAAMAEEGIDMSAEQPKVLTDGAVRASDVVITMGCGDTCPIYPGKRYEDWELDDPAGQGVDGVRPIRDEIKQRVTRLIESLGVPVAAS